MGKHLRYKHSVSDDKSTVRSAGLANLWPGKRGRSVSNMMETDEEPGWATQAGTKLFCYFLQGIWMRETSVNSLAAIFAAVAILSSLD